MRGKKGLLLQGSPREKRKNLGVRQGHLGTGLEGIVLMRENPSERRGGNTHILPVSERGRVGTLKKNLSEKKRRKRIKIW